jgi:hypothetical protein|tara:strand:+ start:785 stop:970 length:186 start_codon:yes stop_codon:yes gene_type:complete
MEHKYNTYFDYKIHEWVAVGLGEREYFGSTRIEAEKARDEGDRIFRRHHKRTGVSWVYRPE